MVLQRVQRVLPLAGCKLIMVHTKKVVMVHVKTEPSGRNLSSIDAELVHFILPPCY